jgi:membrane protein implicated in regulation of membrane protease activity
LIIGTTFAILIVLSVVMVFVLRSRRAFRDKKWQDLSLSRRIWNRLVDISKSGLISILISFVQILAVLTQWDAYLIRSLTQLMNGNVESVGLACFFPGILSRPFASLAVQLTLPLMLACLFALSVVLAALFCRWLDRRERADQVHFESGDISEDETLLLYKVGGMQKKTVEYPAMALISSNTLSIFQFFYFGTSLAATEFFFSSTQAQTGVKYVQALPWMLYSDAKSLRGLSIPWLIFVVVGYLSIGVLGLCMDDPS